MTVGLKKMTMAIVAITFVLSAGAGCSYIKKGATKFADKPYVKCINEIYSRKKIDKNERKKRLGQLKKLKKQLDAGKLTLTSFNKKAAFLCKP